MDLQVVSEEKTVEVMEEMDTVVEVGVEQMDILREMEDMMEVMGNTPHSPVKAAGVVESM